MFCVSCVSHAFASVNCCFVVTCQERADFLALVGYVYCILVPFPCGILGQVWYLIISFPDLCRLSYFEDDRNMQHYPVGKELIVYQIFIHLSCFTCISTKFSTKHVLDVSKANQNSDFTNFKRYFLQKVPCDLQI